MLRSTSFFCIVAASCFSQLAGCNTDGFWDLAQDRQIPKPPADENGTPDIRVAETQEVDLVEQVLYHRKHYRQALTDLRDYYSDRGYHTKRKWADYELADVRKVKPFKYIMDAEIPASSLRPQQAIAEADNLYRKGLDLMERGGHGVPALYREDLMREAVSTFTDLITKYPTSDKIDDAAYCCGEIHKEYFKDQEPLAVKWYERAYTWDPNTPHPVRFQAAVVYDFRLHDRAKALELYHAVIRDEADNKSNAAFASRRIYELTEGIGQIHSPRPPMRGTTATLTPTDMFGADSGQTVRSSRPPGNRNAASLSDPMRARQPQDPPAHRPQARDQMRPGISPVIPVSTEPQYYGPGIIDASQRSPRPASAPVRSTPQASANSNQRANQPTFESFDDQRASKDNLVPIVNLGPDD